MKNLSIEIRKSLNSNIGNRVFSAKEKSYKRHGIEHYVAVRNFAGDINRYLKVFVITALCMGFSGISLMLLTLSGNYNSTPDTHTEAEIVSAGLISHTFACVVAFLLSALMLICIFCVIVSSSEAKIDEYMMMRSLGLSKRKVKRCASIEGRVCIAVGIACGTFSIYWFWNYIMENYYLYQNNISFHGGKMILITLGTLIFLYITVVTVSIIYSKRRINSADIIKSLKEFSY